MELNNSNFRETLVNILAATEEDRDALREFIVIRQGNWFNPQARNTDEGRPLTWCAYRIHSQVPVQLQYMHNIEIDKEEVPCSIVSKIATVQLRFVGEKAEEWAHSVNHWSLRQDVIEELNKYRGQLMAESNPVITEEFFQSGSKSTAYHQTGNNTVLCYNIQIRILWTSVLATSQQLVKIVTLGGEIN